MRERKQHFNTIEDINRDPYKAPVDMKKRRKANRILNVYMGIGLILIIAANILVASPLLIPLAYQFFPSASANELSSIQAGSEIDRVEYVKPTLDKDIPELPPLDTSLPLRNSIRIAKIGVDADIVQGQDIDAALDLGAWIVNDFGTPEDPFAPIIIASHRFGGRGWTAEKRSLMSFYKLPETVPGDRIEIIWNQRRYLYEIYAGEESTKINDYNADLILYTCKVLWESPERIFRYARLVEGTIPEPIPVTQ